MFCSRSFSQYTAVVSNWLSLALRVSVLSQKCQRFWRRRTSKFFFAFCFFHFLLCGFFCLIDFWCLFASHPFCFFLFYPLYFLLLLFFAFFMHAFFYFSFFLYFLFLVMIHGTSLLTTNPKAIKATKNPLNLQLLLYVYHLHRHRLVKLIHALVPKATLILPTLCPRFPTQDPPLPLLALQPLVLRAPSLRSVLTADGQRPQPWLTHAARWVTNGALAWTLRGRIWKWKK